MRQDELVLLAVKLVFGGLAAFLAIFLWSKLIDSAWMALAGGAVTCYAGLVYDMLSAIGVADSAPFVVLALTVAPFFFYILAFVLMIVRTMKN